MVSVGKPKRTLLYLARPVVIRFPRGEERRISGRSQYRSPNGNVVRDPRFAVYHPVASWPSGPSGARADLPMIAANDRTVQSLRMLATEHTTRRRGGL